MHPSKSLLHIDRRHISAITPDDYRLYRHYFDQDGRQACYGNAWFYITQACRGLGLGVKYHDGDSLFSIGYDRGYYVVVRPLGKLDARLRDLLAELRRLSGKPVFIKKLFPDQAQMLQKGVAFAATIARRRPLQPGPYPWSLNAYGDDDTYPELIRATPLSAAWDLAPTHIETLYQAYHGRHLSAAALAFFRKRHSGKRKNIRHFLAHQLPVTLRPYTVEMADRMRVFSRTILGQRDPQHIWLMRIC